MKYYILDNLGKYDDDKYCISESHPDIEDPNSVFEYGGDLSGFYPSNPYEVEMHLDEDSPKHIKKGDYISTSGRYLMVSDKVQQVIANGHVGAIDFWPFTLINHKGQVHSKEYRFVVFRQSFDALNHEASKIKRSKAGAATRIKKVVLAKKKLENAPDIFLINDIRRIAVSEDLAKKLEGSFSNFVFEEAEQE